MFVLQVPTKEDLRRIVCGKRVLLAALRGLHARHGVGRPAREVDPDDVIRRTGFDRGGRWGGWIVCGEHVE